MLGNFQHLLNIEAQTRVCMADFAKIIFDPSDAMLLIARNSFLLILVTRLFSLNTKCFFHKREKIQMSLISRLLSLKKNSVLYISTRYQENVSTLIETFKQIYENDALEIDTLHGAVNAFLETFLSRSYIPLIDQFAILNSLRKGFGFRHDSKYWEVSFDLRTNLIVGISKVEIKLDSSIFIPKLSRIMRQLQFKVEEHDLLCLMYMTILRAPEHRVVPTIPISFELTINQHYQFWKSYLNWDTERSKKIEECFNKLMFSKEHKFFSKKDRGYHQQQKLYIDVDSFQKFFIYLRNARNQPFGDKIGYLSFDPQPI
jgi:hypothetical protein